VEDLLKRRHRAQEKLSLVRNPKPAKVTAPTSVAIEPASADVATRVAGTVELEVLICTECGLSFERLRVRGRKPRLCPGCRAQ
jgi:predicted Zn-ribbon and HTH transcriptional regulator